MGTILSWKGFAKDRDVERLKRKYDVLLECSQNQEKTIADVSVSTKQIMEGIDALQNELRQIRKDYDDFRVYHHSLKNTMESSHYSVIALLQKLNENKLTKDDMEVIASFLRFIAANQLLLEGIICGESAKVSDGSVDGNQR